MPQRTAWVTEPAPNRFLPVIVVISADSATFTGFFVGGETAVLKRNLSIANKTGYIVQFTTGTVPPVFEDNVALANDTDGLRIEPELATSIAFAHNAFVGNKLGVKVVPPGLISAQAVELTDSWVVNRGRSAS